MLTIGSIMLFFSAVGLLTCNITDSIPAKWPLLSIPKDENPALFDIVTRVFWGVGIAGALVLLAQFLGFL
jgi:hypothetical protein